MTIAFHGMGVSRGIAIGKAHIVSNYRADIPEYYVKRNQLEKEAARFAHALAQARQQLRAIIEHIPEGISADITAFIETHLLMMEDAGLTREVTRLIKEQSYNAEWALKQYSETLISVFDEMEDSYLRTRRDDVNHVIERIQRILLGQRPVEDERAGSKLSGYIFMAHDLTPADTVLMQRHRIAAFATEAGGATSHTAIIARSLGIPAIVGLQNALRYIKDGDELIVDGASGVVLAEPDRLVLSQYRSLQKDEKRYFVRLARLKSKPAVTLDGTPITLHANIELPKDLETVDKVGATGIGLYRTEFLYMNRETLPDEEEHYQTYVEVIKALNGLPLTIRTLDLGSDKKVDSDAHRDEQSHGVILNPALGLRAIRLCLKEADLFLTQLRAIIRASAHGPVRIMIPMLSNVGEIQQVLSMIATLKRQLDNKNIAYDRNLRVGGMIEVPAAAVCADIFADQLDFLSLGTNDLIQYTMAIDRVNVEVSYLYEPLNPGVLRLIDATIKAGKRQKVPVAMCGEMAASVTYTRLLLGMGLREFSMHPISVPEVKKIILESDIRKLKALAKRVLRTSDNNAAARILKQYEAKHG